MDRIPLSPRRDAAIWFLLLFLVFMQGCNSQELSTASFGGDNPVMSGSFGPFTSPTNLATCSDIPILQGQDLILTCVESATVNPTAILVFYYGDGPTDANGNGLTVGEGDNPLAAVEASTLVVTLDAASFNFNDDNGGVVTCCALNGLDNPQCASACLAFIVAPDSLTLYDAADDVAGAEYEANRGELIDFYCIATDANPAAGIEWDLGGRGALSGTYVPDPPVSGVDNLYDTYSVLESGVPTPYTYAEGDCDQVLTCATDHPESGGATGSGNELTDSTILKVRVPPDSATLVLIQNDANPAALSGDPTTALTVDENVGTDTVCLLHGRNYDFVDTTDEVDPVASFRWTTTASGVPLQLTNAASNDITCTLATSSDNYDLDSVDCADFDSQNLCVEAWNDANSDDPIETCVALIVKAEVESSNMALSIDGETPDGNVYTLTDTTTYTVDCQVTGAKPLPNIDIDLGEDDFGGAPVIEAVGSADGTDTINPAGTTNGGPCNSADRTGRDTFTADYADHCGEMLICSAINDANRLIADANPLLANAGVQQSTAYTVNIEVGPTITSLSVATEMDATDDDGDAIVYEGNDYVFTCTVTADPEVDIVWTVAGNTITPTDTAAASGVRCDGVDDISTYTLTGVTFADHQCAEVTCTAGGETATIYLQVWTEPTGIALGYREGTTDAFTALSDGDVLHLDAGTQYDFECILYDINPISPLPAGEAEGTCDELSSVRRDVVDIDFYLNGVFDDGESNDDELSTHEGGAGNIFDLTDIYRDTIATEDCNLNLVCNAAYNVNGSPASVDSNTPSISVTILAQNLASIDSFVLNEALGANNIDQDLVPTDENAILIEGEDYYFDCEVTADPNVGVTFTLHNSVGGVLDTATFPNTTPCMAGSYTETYHLNLDDSNNNLVSYDNLQCGYLECTANGQTARITFQVWRAPTSIQLSYALASENRVVTDNIGWITVTDNERIQLDDTVIYDFRCTAEALHPHGTGQGNNNAGGDNPANSVGTCNPNSGETSINRDIANIFFTIDTATAVTDNGVAEYAIRQTADAFSLYNLIDSYEHQVLDAHNCPTTISCRVVFDPDGDPVDNAGAIPSTTVEITHAVAPTINSLTADNAIHVHGSGDVILLDGEDSTFTCDVMGDPSMVIGWSVTDQADDDITGLDIVHTTNAPELAADCSTGPYQSEYTIRGVTFAQLQCAKVACTVGGETVTINVQIWREPDTLVMYFAPAANTEDLVTGTWTPLEDGQNIELETDEAYDFRCIAGGLHPHGNGAGNNVGSPVGTVGLCPAGGETFMNVDIADIYFTINTDPDGSGGSATGTPMDGGATESVVRQAGGGGLYDIYNLVEHTPAAGDDCPSLVSCRLVFDKAGNGPADDTTATPAVTVILTRISLTTAVIITPSDFAGNTCLRGGVDDGASPYPVLSLYDGDTYTLECVPVGADPDSDIIWYLLNTCDGSLDTSTIPDNQIIRDSFEPHEGDADCDEQNTPMKVLGDYDIWTTFLADFEDHNDKCLVCVSIDTRDDQTSYEFAEYELDIIIPPTTTVTLFIEPDGTNPAALSNSPTVVITTSTDVGTGSDALCLLHGRDYTFRGTTDAVNSGADFRWTSSANGAPLQLTPSDSVSCDPTSSTDVLVLTNVDCATYDEEDLCVEVSNGASEVCVTTKVKVEVQQPNMALTIDRDGALVSRVGGVYVLTDGVEYTVDCTVREANPAPNVDIDLGTSDLGGAVNPLGEFDGTNSPSVGGLSSRSGPCNSQDRIGRDTFIANYANHCGEMLMCTAINDANKLLGEGVQTIQVPVQVIVVPSNPADIPTITMISSLGGAVTYTYTDGETVDLTVGTNYFFKCTSVDAAATVPDIAWNLVDHANTADSTQIDSDVVNGAQSCVLDTNDYDIEVTPDLTYHNHRLECVTSTVGGSSSTFILLNIQVSPEPGSLTMHVGGHDGTEPDNLIPIATPSGTNAPYTVAEGDNLEFTCWVQNANPSAHITWTLDGVPLDGNDVEVPDGALFYTLNTLEASNPNADQSDCGHILTCTSTHPETGDMQSVSVELLVEVDPSNVTLSIDDDEDGTLDDDNAILVEGTTYTFTCSVMSDPEVDVEWTFMDASSDPITGASLSELDDNTSDPQGVDCNLQYDETYVLDGNDVTFEDLQFARVTCTAGKLSDSMELQFWKWNTWGEWSECSVTCDGGVRRRTRSCNDFGSGASCEGSNVADEPCSLEDCPEICESGIVVTPYGGLRSPGNQQVGTTHVASEVCPSYTKNEGSPIGSATCVLRSGAPFWDWTWDCGGDLEFNDTSEITPDTVDEMLDMVDDMTRSPVGLGPQDVSNVIKILGDIVDLQLPYRELTDSVIDIVDNLCQVDPDVLMAAQSMNPPTCEAVGIVERQLKNVQVNHPDIGDLPYRKAANNIAAEVYEASNDDLCQGIYVATSQGSEAASNGLLTRERQASTNIDAEIQIPGDICNQYPGGARVVLDVFAGDKLLPSLDIQDTNVAQNDFRRVVNSPVISVTVGDQEVQNLQKPARLLFTPLEVHANNTECVFFDLNRKDWSSEGCTYLGETPNWQRICECDHLTNFAVVMDIYEGFTITKTQAFILEILTYVGCCLAILGCGLTLMTYCSSRNLKSKRPNQILMALTATLMCLYIAFVILISINIGRGKAKLHGVACSVLAGIVHYFTLSSLFWMAVECYNMYLMFVKVVTSYVTNLLLKAAAFAWGVPLIIVAATGAAAREDYARTDVCFLHTWPLVGGVLAPIGIILVFNIVIFVIVIIRLSRERPNSKLKEQRKVLRVRRVGNAICVMTLMCLAWVIGYLTIIKSVSFLSQMIFCLLNAMLGYVIFMCYCVQQPAVRNHWRQSLGTIRKDSARGGNEVFISSRRYTSSSDNRDVAIH